MVIGNLQIGIDIATAISVVIATLTFFYSNIRENKKNREAELNEQKKTRSLRISEYKIEKVTEIIYYLNAKLHELVELNNEIDARLQLKQESNKIRISAGVKNEITKMLRKNELQYNEIPEKYCITELLGKIVAIHQNIKDYLSFNPFLELVGSVNSKDKIKELLAIDTDFYVRVKNIENNPGDFGYFLMREVDNCSVDIGETRKTVEEEHKHKNTLPANYEKQICNACVEDFGLLKDDKKTGIYFKFLKQKLEKLYSLRGDWLCIVAISEESIRNLSSYSYALIQDYEENI